MKLGIAFQLIDDLLDYKGNHRETGKTVFRDLRENKLTMPLLHALQLADTQEQHQVASILKQPNKSEDDLNFVYDLIAAKNGFQTTLTL